MNHRVSRRGLLSGAGAAGAGLLGLAAGQTQRSRRPWALALIGDRYHNPDYIRVSLDRVFKELGVPIDYTISYDQIGTAEEIRQVAVEADLTAQISGPPSNVSFKSFALSTTF